MGCMLYIYIYLKSFLLLKFAIAPSIICEMTSTTSVATIDVYEESKYRKK